MSGRCATCGLPTSMTKTRRDLLQRVADGRWFDGPDSDLGRLDSLARDGLVFWRDYDYVSGGDYRITERGRDLLEADEAALTA